jgi:hypothetical protein
MTLEIACAESEGAGLAGLAELAESGLPNGQR